ncbi:GTP pyrophosphokinase family protein [Microbacterium oleivorans]|uniref:GTP pyrophosphokinase n=1 Tax=Microbacterium oleivorans TaxID=273677 RepID=UPI00080E9614|nr:hypothetical protein [Microbacterium oleivorans]
MTDEWELKYDDYVAWYTGARKSFLAPALATALRLMGELLDARVDSVDRGRFRISASRVKSAQRSFAKLSNDKYRSRLRNYAQTPDVLDDLVGMRLVCNNLSDINTLQEILGELPLEDGSSAGLTVEPDSHRDYFSDPKPSGYRAYHVNLVVPVPQMTGHRRVRVEVQARTLLQDGWGELTHEDTYKPGSTVPDWIVGMSLRMAELLAAVDNIAQDLRTGLDIETQRSVLSSDGKNDGVEGAHIGDGSAELVIATASPLTPASHPVNEDERSSDEPPESDPIESAVLSETQRLVGALAKPTALAVVAQDLNTIFGAEITRTWAKFGGFKKLVQIAVPEAALSGPAPGYIHPPNTPIPDDWTTENTGEGSIPDLVRALRTYDKAVPLVGTQRLNDVIVAVTNALRDSDARALTGSATISQIEALARKARADAESRDRLVVRPHAVYVLQALNRAGRVSSDISDAEVRAIVFARIFRLAEQNHLIEDALEARRELAGWLGVQLTS